MRRLSPRAILAASLILNLVLGGVGVHHALKHLPKSHTPPSAVTPEAEPPGRVIASPPNQPWTMALDRYEAARPTHAYRGDSGAAFAPWREAGVSAFARTLGYTPAPFGGEVRVTEVAEFPKYTRTKLYLKTSYGFWLPAYLLVPRGAGRRPAVLALPGHDGPPERGAKAIVSLDTPGNYMRAFGRRLAEAGYVVLAVDMPGVGELEKLQYWRLLAVGLLTDYPLKRIMLECAHQALDYLLGRPEVNAAATGTMGVSLGGELAMYLGVLDQRVKFVGASGFFAGFKDYNPWVSPSLFIPGLLRVADVPDLAAMVAPRPLWLQVGKNDRLLSVEAAKTRFDTVRRAYAAAGAPGRARLDVQPGGHEFVVPPALNWMKAIAPADATGPQVIGR